MAKAIHYALERWPALMLFLEDGRAEMGRGEMWRGGLGSAYLFPVLSFPVSHYPTMLPFPHPAHQTGRADFPKTEAQQEQANPCARRSVRLGIVVPNVCLLPKTWGHPGLLAAFVFRLCAIRPTLSAALARPQSLCGVAA